MMCFDSLELDGLFTLERLHFVRCLWAVNLTRATNAKSAEAEVGCSGGQVKFNHIAAHVQVREHLCKPIALFTTRERKKERNRERESVCVCDAQTVAQTNTGAH